MNKPISSLIGLLLACLAMTTAGATGNGHEDARYQTSNVIGIDSVYFNGPYVGAATLVREKNEISGRIMANVPEAGVAYTLWVIVVNNPHACAGGINTCGEADLANPATKTTIFNGSGAIAASDGNEGGVVNMDFEVEAGRLPNDQFVLLGHRYALRNNRGFKAVVWLIIDRHPPLTPFDAWIADLTTTHDPGAGPNVSTALAIFSSCLRSHCPDSIF